GNRQGQTEHQRPSRQPFESHITMRARALSDRPHAQHEPQGADDAHHAAPEKDTPADPVALARIQDGTTHNTTTTAHDKNPLRTSRITNGNTNTPTTTNTATDTRTHRNTPPE
ncbi:hypothetical protein, partial [Bifidobacterium asteroides]|uniref:hypothetical protein n=1 Tax=Bifidobacterium asteroides TaxID=1684 RepID=UPI001C64CA82